MNDSVNTIITKNKDIFESIHRYYLKDLGEDKYELYLKKDDEDLFTLFEDSKEEFLVIKELLETNIEIRE